MTTRNEFIWDVFWRNKEQLYANALLLTNNHQDAEDIAVDVAIKAVEKYKLHQDEKVLKSWLFKSKCYISIDRLRRNTNYVSKLKQISAIKKDSVNIELPEKALSDKYYREEFWNCFSRLSILDQKLLLLFAYEEMSYKEIAKAHDLPVSTIKSHLYRARIQLKDMLTEHSCKEV